MQHLSLLAKARQHFTVGIGIYALLANLASPTPAVAQKATTTTPIQHVIVIIGENRTFDHVFATYQPPAGQTVNNLLSQGIVNANGTPGPNFSLAKQYKATDKNTYSGSPGGKVPWTYLPPTNVQFAPPVASDAHPAPFQTLAAAMAAEPGLSSPYINLLTTGATGIPFGMVDTRVKNVYTLPNGPYQLTPSVGYDDYAGSPVHRFYQMWQQLDCNTGNATSTNPSGCASDLFPWVEVSIGAGSNGNSQPNPFNVETTLEGSISMGFYNVQQGDAPYLTSLAQNYAMSDNMHQGVQGGTGANHIMLGSGTAFAYSDGSGHLAVPPSEQIEDPNPMAGTNNWYTQDGYSGGTYSLCSDHTQAGVNSVFRYLNTLPYTVHNTCQSGAYYLLNNYAPGYYGDGSLNTNTFVIPPVQQPTIADSLNAAGVNWKYYGDGWNLYLTDPNYNNPDNAYCDICNFAQYETSIMTSSTQRSQHLADVTDLYNDIAGNTLPPVSFVKPSGFVDGHPASSKLDLFEGFVNKIATQVQANAGLWANTAIIVTFDEGGGYWDSGYVQPLDFFGDGTRIPLVVVSPYSTGGRVVHTYYDHVSILKFIEANWGLSPVTTYGRDNLSNPIPSSASPYVPANSPAIGDLMDMFNFGSKK
jgi:phospholipase C